MKSPLKVKMVEVMGILLAVLKSMRPHQWTKNAFVLAAVVFAPKLNDVVAVYHSLLTLVAFCLVSGAVYILNDIQDIDKDRLHPDKKNRPLAAGQLTTRTAWIAVLVLAGSGFILGAWLRPAVLGILVIYGGLNLAYSYWLKREVILDVLIIALGYVLRVEAGGLAISVPISNYLWLCTILLALLLALGKRRYEIMQLEDAANHRAILKEYSQDLLDKMMGVMTASILVSYALYTEEAVGGQKNLIWTVPFVIYGIFRYLYLIHRKEMGGDPAEMLFKDWRMSVNILLWLLVAISFIYFVPSM